MFDICIEDHSGCKFLSGLKLYRTLTLSKVETAAIKMKLMLLYESLLNSNKLSINLPEAVQINGELFATKAKTIDTEDEILPNPFFISGGFSNSDMSESIWRSEDPGIKIVPGIKFMHKVLLFDTQKSIMLKESLDKLHGNCWDQIQLFDYSSHKLFSHFFKSSEHTYKGILRVDENTFIVVEIYREFLIDENLNYLITVFENQFRNKKKKKISNEELVCKTSNRRLIWNLKSEETHLNRLYSPIRCISWMCSQHMKKPYNTQENLILITSKSILQSQTSTTS